VAEILDMAEVQLTRHGAEGLSVRAVAQALDISVGNLQYYFATRADLLDAIFNRQADRFRAELTEQLLNKGGDPRTDLLIIIDYWLGVQFDASQALFWHLWAISAHDDNARTTMVTVYDQLLNRIAKLLRTIHQPLTSREALQRAAAMGALIDGSGLYVGFGRRPSPHLVDLQDEIRRDVIEIIDRLPRPTRRRQPAGGKR
jgi:AcrR family transcriptional regulator